MERKQALTATALGTLALFVLLMLPPPLAFTLSAVVVTWSGLAARRAPEEA